MASTGASACTACSAGRFCNSTGLSAVSGSCPAGSFSASGASSSSCSLCVVGSYCPGTGGQHRHRLPRGRLLRRDGFVGGRQLFRWPVFVGDRHVDGQYMPAMSHRFVLPVCWHGERDPVSCWFLLQRHGSVGIGFVHGGFVRFHHWAHCVRDCRARFFREHVGRVASSGVRSRGIRVVDWSLDLQRVSRWQFCQCFWNVDQYALRCRQLRRHHGLVCLCTGTRW